jgi:Ca2+-binding EF-hand superfamily protein
MTHDEFAMLDKNHDGKLSKAEIAADSHLAPHFGMLDTDRNGALSRAEYAKGDGM